MHGEFNVVVVGRGVHGPFKDEAHPEDRTLDRSYLYSTLAATDGSGSRNVTHIDGLGELPVALFTECRVLLDIRDNGKHKLVALIDHATTSLREAA